MTMLHVLKNWWNRLLGREPLYDIIIEVAGSWTQYERAVLFEQVPLDVVPKWLETILSDEDSAVPGDIYIDHIDNEPDCFAVVGTLRDHFKNATPPPYPGYKASLNLLPPADFCQIFAIRPGDNSRKYSFELLPNLEWVSRRPA